MKSRKKQQPDGQSPLVTDAAERIAAIIDGAERAAARVIDDAEEQARRHLEEAQDRADRVVAERLRALADELDSHVSAVDERPKPHLKPVEALEPEPEVGGDGAVPRRAGSAGARLLATQMAVSGSSREEIEARLRSGFEIEDTREILDAILGPEE